MVPSSWQPAGPITLASDSEARFLGVPVYAGGDDLLGFLPAGTALDAARACRDTVTAELPTASTAVVFFHRSHSLRDALVSARDLLKEAKERVQGKNALGVCYLRRSGVQEKTIRPWHDRFTHNAEERLKVFTADSHHPLSPRLLRDLERDEDELAALCDTSEQHYRAELARLVRRHMAGNGRRLDAAARDVADQLVALGKDEALCPRQAKTGGSHPVPAARVAVFLRNEAWSYAERDDGTRDTRIVEPEETP